MKKLVIAGSSKLHERALYWRGYFEGRGYEVIDWPCPSSMEAETIDEPQTAPGLSLGRWLSSNDDDYAERLTKVYQRFYKNLDQADVFFLMNEDKNGVEGYIGASMIAEITYAVIGNLNRGRKVEINILKMPAKEQNCYEEVKFWLDQKWVKIYQKPTGKKATIPVEDEHEEEVVEESEVAEEVEPQKPALFEASVTIGAPDVSVAPKTRLFGGGEKTVDIVTCSKKCLKSLTPEAREYLKVLAPEFPAWLLKYLAAPEMQRLTKVSNNCGLMHTNLYQYKHEYMVFLHSVATALIVWNLTHDKKQTLAALLHDIASPAFKHSIDFMNNDAEHQESTEADTGKMIRESRVITRLLKKDGILVSEVSDYRLYPLADNEIPGLSADRLEYTLANGYFLYDTWTLDDVKEIYQDLVVVKNESGVDEMAFASEKIAAKFTKGFLALSEIYQGDKSRANMQFIADILHSMIVRGDLTTDDLYVMSEREIIDWILSCGDKVLSEAFRNYQRATTVVSSNTLKKNIYCVPAGYKVRYAVPLVQTEDGVKRVTELDRSVDKAVKDFLDLKPAKYVGFDFDFKPYTE